MSRRPRAPSRAGPLAAPISVTVERRPFRFSVRTLRRDLGRAAQEAGWSGELSVAIVSDERIRQVNREFLGHDSATDVLAFPLPPAPEGAPEGCAGELVLSAETAARVADARGCEPYRELLLYAVHGLLHLRGHQDATPSGRARMRREERRILEGLGYPAG